MPYAEQHRHEKDAERKRLARQARGTAIGGDFNFWFQECVDEIPPSKDDGREWSMRLAALMPSAEESDRSLRRYHSGETRHPRAESAYAIGWALHDLNLNWCSGPVALAAASHTPQFFRMLAHLSGFGEPIRHAALRLGLSSYTANAPIKTLRGIVVMNRARKKLPHHDFTVSHRREVRELCRAALSEAAKEREAIDAAWEDRASELGLRLAAAPFRLALEIVTSTRCSEPLRVAVAVSLLAKAALSGISETEFGIANELEPFIPRIPTMGFNQWRSGLK